MQVLHHIVTFCCNCYSFEDRLRESKIL